jgi:hypothetical protein
MHLLSHLYKHTKCFSLRKYTEEDTIGQVKWKFIQKNFESLKILGYGSPEKILYKYSFTSIYLISLFSQLLHDKRLNFLFYCLGWRRDSFFLRKKQQLLEWKLSEWSLFIFPRQINVNRLYPNYILIWGVTSLVCFLLTLTMTCDKNLVSQIRPW